MHNSETRSLISEIIAAHGGTEFWNSLDSVEATISASGFLFAAKQRAVLQKIRFRAWAHEPRALFHDFPQPGQTGELLGDAAVVIRDDTDRIIARREHPRASFTGLRRVFSWDDLDFLYFAAYATWNYLVTPFLFLRPGFSFERLDPQPGEDPSWVRLRVTFPPDIPTHCRTQVFCFDDRRHLRRQDYTATVVGGWARAAHLCSDYRSFGGLIAPTRRRVLPLFGRQSPLPWPTLVALDIHDIRPVPAADSPVPHSALPRAGNSGM